MVNYIGLKEVRDRVIELEKSSDKDLSQILACGLLPRYGILGNTGEQIYNLKMEDIDKDNRIINIRENGKVVRKVRVDDYLIKILDKAYNVPAAKNCRFEDEDYIIKHVLGTRANHVPREECLRNLVFNRFNQFKSLCDFPNYSARTFYFMRQLDYLNSIEQSKGECSSRDYINVYFKFRGYINPGEIKDLKMAHKSMKNDESFKVAIRRYKMVKITNEYISNLEQELDAI